MKVLSILQAPQKVLVEKTKPVTKITPSILNLIEDMKYTLIKQEAPKGVGLSANQVGRPLQLFVLREAEDKPFRVFINPKLKILRTAKVAPDDPDKDVLEGCLSISNIWGVVDRAPKVKVKYMSEDGKMHNETFTGFIARIVQHECDHLDGILFPIRVIEAKKTLYAEGKDDKGEETFTPIGPSFNISG